MSRRKSAAKREILPDSKYNNLVVAKCINVVMWDGKKEVADVPNLKKAVELYKLARDFKRRDEDGAKPIQADLALLEGIRDFADFNLKAPDLFKAAFALPFSFDVDADMKNKIGGNAIGIDAPE